jgi:hypothetical protein
VWGRGSVAVASSGTQSGEKKRKKSIEEKYYYCY